MKYIVFIIRFIANQKDISESDSALNAFAGIIADRPYETSQIIALLKPQQELDSNSEEAENEKTGEGGGVDLASFGANKATDFFLLKFLLCNDQGQ